MFKYGKAARYNGNHHDTEFDFYPHNTYILFHRHIITYVHTIRKIFKFSSFLTKQKDH